MIFKFGESFVHLQCNNQTTKVSHVRSCKFKMSVSTLSIEESIKQTKLRFAKTKELWKDVENSEFHEYIWNFYGPGNDSWEFFTENPLTMQEVQVAIETYRTLVAPTLFGHSGYSNSFDREMVRDILFLQKGMRKTNEVEHAHGLKKIFTPTGRFKKGFGLSLETLKKIYFKL